MVRDYGPADDTASLVRQAAAGDRRIVLLDAVMAAGRRPASACSCSTPMTGARTTCSLADQDDVWHPDKIERMLERMALRGDAGRRRFSAEDRDGQSCPENLLRPRRLPHLVYSDLTVVDAELRLVHPLFCAIPGFATARAGRCGTLLGRSFVLGCALIVQWLLLEFSLPLPETVVFARLVVGSMLRLRSDRSRSCPSPRSTIDGMARTPAARPAFGKGFNPLRHSCRLLWEVGWRSFRQSLDQVRALQERLRERCPG